MIQYITINYSIIYCHFLKHMKHFQLKSRASMRASISHVRARDARAFQTRARETREQRQARARCARARRASHHARARRSRTSQIQNKLTKRGFGELISARGELILDLESLFVRARRARATCARCAREGCARCAREVRARDDSRALLAHIARAPLFARASRARMSEMLARSRCAPRGWWGTIYEPICFESSQII